MAERNIKTSEMAKRLGCPTSTVCQWCSGRYLPRLDYVPKICEILDCSADELLALPPRGQGALPKVQGRELIKAVTHRGRYNSGYFHRLASTLRTKGKPVTEFEVWIRALAESLYKIELATRRPSRPQSATDLQQLPLPFGA